MTHGLDPRARGAKHAGKGFNGRVAKVGAQGWNQRLLAAAGKRSFFGIGQCLRNGARPQDILAPLDREKHVTQGCVLMTVAQGADSRCFWAVWNALPVDVQRERVLAAVFMLSWHGAKEDVEKLASLISPLKVAGAQVWDKAKRAIGQGNKGAAMALLPWLDYAADEDGVTPLIFAAGKPSVELEMLRGLMERCDPKSQSRQGVTALMSAAISGSVGSALELLAVSDPEVRDGLCGRTPLLWAAARGREDMVLALMQHCDIAALDNRGRGIREIAREDGRSPLAIDAADVAWSLHEAEELRKASGWGSDKKTQAPRL